MIRKPSFAPLLFLMPYTQLSIFNDESKYLSIYYKMLQVFVVDEQITIIDFITQNNDNTRIVSDQNRISFEQTSSVLTFDSHCAQSSYVPTGLICEQKNSPLLDKAKA